MSAPHSIYMVLPAWARNIDEELEPEAESSYDRLLKKIMVWDGEVLGVTELAFYYVYVDVAGAPPRYAVRERLLDLLVDERLSLSPLLSGLLDVLRRESLEDRVRIAYSLISSLLPSHLSAVVDRVVSAGELARILADYAAQRGVVLGECEEVDVDVPHRWLYSSYMRALEVLRVPYKPGRHGGAPCFVIGGAKKHGVHIPG